MAQGVLFLYHSRDHSGTALIYPVNFPGCGGDLDVGYFTEAVFLLSLYDFNLFDFGKGNLGNFDTDVYRFSLVLVSSGIFTIQFITYLGSDIGEVNAVNTAFQTVDFNIYLDSGDARDFFFNGRA